MRIYTWIVGSIQGHLRVWGAILFCLSLLSFWQASQLRLDGDLGRLLPEDAPSVQGLRALESVYGNQIGRLTVVLQNKNPIELKTVADGLSKDLATIPDVLIFPIWLGLGVDASFHLLIHLRDHPDEPKLHAATIVSIAAAFTTSMIGFGALSMSHHVGLSSLGTVAVLGFTVMLVLNLILGLHIAMQAARSAS